MATNMKNVKKKNLKKVIETASKVLKRPSGYGARTKILPAVDEYIFTDSEISG
jgi:hypothetical protein